MNGVHGKLDKDIRLKLIGFSLQKRISVDEILNAIDKLPDTHISGLNSIEYDPTRETLIPSFIAKLFRRAPKYCKGVFFQSNRKIIIYEFDSKAMFYHILFHEIGHFVYLLVLNSQLKKLWVTGVHKSNPFVTLLSKRNAAEDFAECYAIYITKPETLKQSRDKYNFIHKHVFGNNLETENKSLYFNEILIDKTY